MSIVAHVEMSVAPRMGSLVPGALEMALDGLMSVGVG